MALVPDTRKQGPSEYRLIDVQAVRAEPETLNWL